MNTGTSISTIRRHGQSLGLSLGLLLAPLGAWAADAGSAEVPDYSSYSHHQLTELGTRWDELGEAERRALLQEVKHRMAQQKDADGVLQIRTQRRYGRIVRQSDGRVLRIETQVVEVRPVRRPPSPERSFGVGFENRTKAESGTEDELAKAPPPQLEPGNPPMVRVNDTPN